MKKILLILSFTVLQFNAFAQDCQAREDKLFELVNNFSTAYLFNTYGLIGSLADGFGHDAYDEATVTDLLNAQKKLAQDLVVLLDKKLNEGVFADEKRKDFTNSFISILKEFNIQIDLFLKMVKNNSKKNQDAYFGQRKKSWKDISKLVGIED